MIETEELLDRLNDQGLYSKAERIQMIKDAAAEITILRAQLASARKALQFIADGYENHDINHVDYRVKVYQAATEVLEELSK